MQYGINIATYNKRDRNKSDKSTTTALKVIMYIVTGVMLSRVVFTIVGGVGVAPFGIAYLLAILISKNHNNKVVAAFGVLLGYLSIYKSIENGNVYLIITISLYLFSVVSKFLKGKRWNEVYLFIIVGTFVIYELVLGSNLVFLNIGFALLQGIVVIPVYYIIRYGIRCMEDFKTNYFFSTEELISVFILVCLIVSGIGSVSLLGISIRNIVALSVVIVAGYVAGVGLGATVGIAMGIIVGISGGEIINLISLYSVCGMIVGIFKDTGRVLSIISYAAVYSIVIIYSNNFQIYTIVEGVLATLLLLIIPKNLIDIAVREVNNEKKIELINEKNLKGIKCEFSDRLDELKKILIVMSKSVRNLSENGNLLIKSKGSALVETLADRVCSECELNRRCWERDLNNTFYSFSELIRSCEGGNIEFPEYLSKRCLKRNCLMKNTQELIDNNKVNEEVKEKFQQGRNIVARHMENMASSMGDIIKDFNKDITVSVDMERLLKKRFNKKGISYDDVFCYTDRNGRLKVKIISENCEGANYCKKMVLPIVGESLNRPVNFSCDGCSVDPKNNKCSIIIEETPKYNILSEAITEIKDGEVISGDSYSYGKNNDGIYTAAVSDGMGSGPEAGVESKMAIELLENFIEAGFDYKTAINSINSIIGMKVTESEKFTTLDLNIIDLYTGETKIVKSGGAVSFIKTGSEVDIIKCNSLPVGIVDNIDITVENRKLNHGSIIVTLSDGVTDVEKNKENNLEWIENYIRESSNGTIRELAEGIIKNAKEKCGGKVEDDMTVVVSKLYSVY